MDWKYPYNDIALWPIKWSATSVNRLKESHGNTEDNNEYEKTEYRKGSKSAVAKHDSSWYTDLGNCVHYLLEKANLKEISSGTDPQKLFGILLADYDCDESIKSAVNLRKLAGFYKSDIGKELLRVFQSEGIIRREADFTLVLTIEDFAKVLYNCDVVSESIIADFSRTYNLDYRIEHNEKVFFQGVIDLCFLTERGWVLVDYKSGRNNNLTDKDVIDRYGSQLKLYEIALERITGKKVLKKCIYFTADNRLVYV